MQKKGAGRSGRREFLCRGAALSAAIFPGIRTGANDRIGGAFIGTGRMGTANLGFAMARPGVEVVALCDVYQPNLDRAMAMARKGGHRPKQVRDFRDVLGDASVDFVCISTPDHWHAYMTVEACKAGKDVYVEKPLCLTIDEGRIMTLAARKYGRVVQAGTMQRSARHFRSACEIVRRGDLGEVTFVRTFNWSNQPREGIGNPPDTAPPPALDWDMWLGPAPERPFNPNRFGVNDRRHSYFRWFWDYAGGMMTDWGVHWLDIVQMAFAEAMPRAATALGGKMWYKDNRETPDTLEVTYRYPGFIATYEHRSANHQSMFDRNSGIIFHGSEATLFADRTRYSLIPEKKGSAPVVVQSADTGNEPHWADFLACVRSRRRPVSDIEACFRSTTTCLLGNIAFRSGLRLEWEPEGMSLLPEQARKYAAYNYRRPWELVL